MQIIGTIAENIETMDDASCERAEAMLNLIINTIVERSEMAEKAAIKRAEDAEKAAIKRSEEAIELAKEEIRRSEEAAVERWKAMEALVLSAIAATTKSA